MLFDNPQLQKVSKYIPEWLKEIPNDLKLGYAPHGIESLNELRTVKTCGIFIDIYKEGGEHDTCTL